MIFLFMFTFKSFSFCLSIVPNIYEVQLLSTKIVNWIITIIEFV